MNDEFLNSSPQNNIPDGKSFEDKVYTMRKPPEMQQTFSPNTAPTPDVPPVPNNAFGQPARNVPDNTYRPPLQNVPDNMYRPPVQNVPDNTYRPPVQNVPDNTYRPPVQGVPNNMYRPPVQGIPNSMYRPPVQNIPNTIYSPPMQPAYPNVPNNYRYFYQPSPEEIERQNIKKDFMFSGTATLVLLGSLFLVGIIIMIISMISGVVQSTPSLDDPYYGFTPIGFYAYEGLASLLGIFIPSIILAKASKVSMNELFPFKKIGGKYLAALVIAGMAVCMIAQIVVSLMIQNVSLFGIDLESSLEQESASGFADIMLSTVCIAVIPALVEEFAFRGVVLGVLKKHDEMFAIFASAFLFGLLHGNFVQIPFAFIVGLVAAFVRVKSNSMLPSILIHFGNNFYATIMTALPDLLPEGTAALVEIAITFILVFAGIIAAYYLIKNHNEIFEQKKPGTKYSFKELNKMFLSSGTIIACMIILILSSLVLVSAM